MFTGLVQAVGQVQRRSSGLLVNGCEAFAPLQIGDSVAVDGVCLTVASLVGEGFLADVSEETLRRTTLGPKADRGGVVNLEPALRLSDRLGGHLVSGHVDGAAEVLVVEALPHSWHLEVRWIEDRFSRYVCEKASIAVDGISLTVAGCAEEGSRFWIAVIPHTWSATSLQYLCPGDLVNLEADLMAKYAERLLQGSIHSKLPAKLMANDLSTEWLSSHGWS